MTSSHHAFMAWATHMLQWLLIEEAKEHSEQTPKTESQFGLQAQPACMKQESLVIAGQHTVNTFPGLVHTARHTTKVIHTKPVR